MEEHSKSARSPGEPPRASFPRTFAALDDVFAFTDAFFVRERIAEEDRFAINFAIEEIFTNMVKYNPGTARDIDVGLSRSGGRVTVTLVDRGVAPFDVTQVPDAQVDLPLEERAVGGLGLHLTRRVMDGIAYDHAGGTSTITMTRTLVGRDV